MCDRPDCETELCIYDDDVQSGMQLELLTAQIQHGYFDDSGE